MSALTVDVAYKSLGILEMDDFKYEKMREIVKKEYFKYTVQAVKD